MKTKKISSYFYQKDRATGLKKKEQAEKHQKKPDILSLIENDEVQRRNYLKPSPNISYYIQ